MSELLITLGLLLPIFLPQPDAGAHEPEWSDYLADEIGGEREYRLPDGSRVDILTDTHAWEVEWSDKWEQAIGQSGFYAISTDRRPGVWLLLRGDSDEDYLRCLAVCRRWDIDLKTVRVR